VVLDQACTAVPPANLHGKEGVDGSSPSEGLKYLQMSLVCCLLRRGSEDGYGGGRVDNDLQALLLLASRFGASKGSLRELARALGSRPRPLMREVTPRRSSTWRCACRRCAESVMIRRMGSRAGSDVVVLGAGLAGLSAALGFARRGRSVLVLQRGAPALDGAAEELFRIGSVRESRISASRTTSWRSAGRCCARRRRRFSTGCSRSARARTTSTSLSRETSRPRPPRHPFRTGGRARSRPRRSRRS
jgi:FAD binding domain